MKIFKTSKMNDMIIFKKVRLISCTTGTFIEKYLRFVRNQSL